MASLYPLARSPFWYVQFTNEKGERKNKSTGLRRDCPKETAEARILVAELAKKEITKEAKEGWGWVEKYLDDSSKGETRKRYQTRWEWVSLYLAENNIRNPDQVRFEHGQDYIDWRISWVKKTGFTVCRNTAIYELKIFSRACQRAFQLGMCANNPLVKLGIKKDDPEEKPEIMDEEFSIILPALEKEPAWMRNSFLIAMHTGCRLKDTRIRWNYIDFRRETITFIDPKGGKKRAFTIPLPPVLKPILLELKKQGKEYTLEFPFQPSRAFQQFFQKLELDHLCFHCTRVTFITRLARAGVPLSVAMRLVNHASQTIHAIYQRLRVSDLRGYVVSLYETQPSASD